MSDRFKQITDDILDKLSKGYVFDPARFQQIKDSAMTTNKADATIEKPFEEAEGAPLVLTADNIVERTEKDGENAVYDVVKNEKVLFSAISAPLAHAWIGGFNANPRKGAAKPSEDDDAEDDTNKPKTEAAKGAEVDPADVSASRDKQSGSNNDRTAPPVPQRRKRSAL